MHFEFDNQCKSRYLPHFVAGSSESGLSLLLFKLMASRDTEKPEEAEEERIHFQNVITAFQQYAPYTVCPCAFN
jgi:hypothetical protein